jgi:hypothetical protein
MKIVALGVAEVCERPRSSYLGGIQNIFKIQAKIPSVHTVDVYVNFALLPFLYTLYF